MNIDSSMINRIPDQLNRSMLNRRPDQVDKFSYMSTPSRCSNGAKVGRLLLDERFLSEAVITSTQCKTIFVFSSKNNKGYVWRLVQLVKLAIGALLLAPIYPLAAWAQDPFTVWYRDSCSNRWNWVKTGIETHIFFGTGKPDFPNDNDRNNLFDESDCKDQTIHKIQWMKEHEKEMSRSTKNSCYYNIANYALHYAERKELSFKENQKPATVSLEFIKEAAKELLEK